MEEFGDFGEIIVPQQTQDIGEHLITEADVNEFILMNENEGGETLEEGEILNDPINPKKGKRKIKQVTDPNKPPPAKRQRVKKVATPKATGNEHAWGKGRAKDSDRKNNDRATPRALYEFIVNFGEGPFRCNYDPCPVGGWEKAQSGEGPDGLTSEWGERNFVNPPWPDNKKWIKKAVEEYEKGKYVVLMLPARMQSDYWATYLNDKASACYIMRHSKNFVFDGYVHACPFPVALVVLDPEDKVNRPLNNEVKLGPFSAVKIGN